MRIHVPQIVRRRPGETAVQATFEYAGGGGTLYYSVSDTYADYLSERAEAFVLALLPLAMRSGESLQVDGLLSASFFYNLSNFYQHILVEVLPEVRSIKIIADNLDT